MDVAGSGIQGLNGLGEPLFRTGEHVIHGHTEVVGLLEESVQVVVDGVQEVGGVLTQAVQGVTDILGIAVELVGHGLEVLVPLCAGVVGTVLDLAHGIFNDLGIVQPTGGDVVDLVHKGAHLVKEEGQTVIDLVQRGGTVGELGVGLKLAGDAAHVLAALDGPGVGTVQDTPGLESHDAAYVVAQVDVAHGAGVAAALDGAPGEAGNAPHAGGRVLVGGGVDLAAVGAVLKGAQVLSGDAAGIGGAGDSGSADTVGQSSALAIEAHQSPHILNTGGGAIGGAAANGAVVLTRQQAYLAGGAAGGHGPFHSEVLHHRGLSEGTKESHAGALLGEGEALDGVAVAQKGALKDGDGGEAAAAQVDVGVQGHGEALGPGIPGTVLGEVQKVLPAADDQVGARRQGRKELTGEEGPRQQQGGKSF